MALPAPIAEKLTRPVYNVLQQLSALSFPAGFQLAVPGDPGGVQGQYGTVVPARKNFKPFVVGLIPPDVPVDFVAFRRAGGVLTELDNLKDAPLPTRTDKPVTDQRAQIDNLGKVTRVRQNADIAQVRQAVYDSYVKYAHSVPSDATINLITAQMAFERGRAGNSIPTWNFNFGNSHAPGGTQGTYQPGFVSPADRRALGNEGGPEVGIDKAPTPPAGGTYYLSTDTNGKGDYYPVYFTGFTSLEQGVDYQVNLLLRRYPAAATATSVDEYMDGLVNGVGDFSYFEAPPATYQRGMQRNFDSISGQVNSGGLGGQLGGTVRPPEPAANQRESAGGGRFIMSMGSVTDLTSDPAGDRVGKFVEADPDRQRLVDQQVQALRAQIEAIQAVPGLLLLVNPSEFSRSYEHSVDNTVKGRQKNIVHTWLERPFSINSSGVTAGQYVVAGDGGGGITNTLRVYSASYQNLLSLLAIYKTNGLIYSGPEIHGDPRVRQLGYSIFIYYDNHIYIGSFDSFEIQDSELKPHNMAYSWKFNVRYDIDVGNDGRFTDFEVGVQSGFFPQALPAVS